MYESLKSPHLKGTLVFSRMLDSCYSRLANHQLRTAYISLRISLELQLSVPNINDLLTSALMHDIGALKPEDKFALHEGLVESLDDHCILGAKVLSIAKIFENSSKIVRYHHTSYEVWGDINNDIALLSQILNLSDAVERNINRDSHVLLQYQDIRKTIKDLADKEIEKTIVDTFLAISEKEEFWLDLVSPFIERIIYDLSPTKFIVNERESFYEISLVHRKIIDFRSPFTATHSCGAGSVAESLAILLGFTVDDTELLKIAANVHDIGKMVIPTNILEKPGRLTDEEYCIIKTHPYYTYLILKEFELGKVAEWAGLHHERLDGKGYPFRKDSSEIDIGACIIAVADVCTALAEDRPYRKGMSEFEAVNILKEMADTNHLSKDIVKSLIANYGEIVDKMTLSQRQTIEDYWDMMDNGEKLVVQRM